MGVWLFLTGWAAIAEGKSRVERLPTFFQLGLIGV